MLSSETGGGARSSEAKPRFVDRLVGFLHKYRLVLLGLLIALIAFLVGYFVWTEWSKRSRERSTLMAERAQKLFEQWQDETEEAQRATLETELDTAIGQILSKYPRQYAAQRAYFLRAAVAYEQQQWEQAAESYTSLANSFPKSYLAPLSLFNAGVSYEQMDDLDQATAAYREVAEEYGDSYLVPHALFSLGRLYEEQEQYESAFEAYNRLEDEHPQSNWTKAGRNRIIELKIRGVIAE